MRCIFEMHDNKDNVEYERYVKDDALLLECRIYGYAPVQAEGIVAQKRFYFRARHDEWTFSIALPVDIDFPYQGFYREEHYGKPRDKAASHMPYDDAEMFIRRCAREFLDTLKL